MDNFSLVPQAENEITVIQHSEGFAVFGDSTSLDDWLGEAGVSVQASPIRVSQAAADASKGLAMIGQLMEQSGRWVKLDSTSAKLVKKYGLKSGVFRGEQGKIIKHVQFAKVGGLISPGGVAVLGSVLAQQAIEQSIAEVVRYLERIDDKVNLLVQDQKDQAVASLFSHRQVVAEAVIIREQTGIVSGTTWSKVANISQDVTRMQKYALLKVKTLADNLQNSKSASELKNAAEQAQRDIPGWLMVLGNSIVIQDQLSLLELDRVAQEDIEMLESHRKGIELARASRMAELESALVQLGDQLNPAWNRAEKLQIRHPHNMQKTFDGLIKTDGELDQLARSLQISENSWDPVEVSPWLQAVGNRVRHLGKRVSENVPSVEINVRFNNRSPDGEATKKSKHSER